MAAGGDGSEGCHGCDGFAWEKYGEKNNGLD
jgi:hypothetical protein